MIDHQNLHHKTKLVQSPIVHWKVQWLTRMEQNCKTDWLSGFEMNWFFLGPLFLSAGQSWVVWNIDWKQFLHCSSTTRVVLDEWPEPKLVEASMVSTNSVGGNRAHFASFNMENWWLRQLFLFWSLSSSSFRWNSREFSFFFFFLVLSIMNQIVSVCGNMELSCSVLTLKRRKESVLCLCFGVRSLWNVLFLWIAWLFRLFCLQSFLVPKFGPKRWFETKQKGKIEIFN